MQEPDAGKVAPLSVNVAPETVADIVPPGQLVAALVGLAITMPLGKLSVTPAPVIAVAFELVSVTVKVDLLPAPILDGTKALATEGPTSPLLTADTVIEVAGPAPSGSTVAMLLIVPPVVTTTLNWTVAALPKAMTPGD